MVKEADTLAEAGYAVRVVSVNCEPVKWELDRRLMMNRLWQLAPVHVDRRLWLLSGIRQKLLARSPRLWVRDGEDWAYSRYHRQLGTLAASREADLFIAHTLQALPAAFRAARSQKARLGFDAEDFHRGELTEAPETVLARKLIALIEQKYMPQCNYISAASPGIAQAYARCFNIRTPHVILNAFPLSERSGATPASELAQERKGDGVSLYWYSQVIGRDRGLADAVKALGLVRGKLHLHLRGRWANGYEQELLSLAGRSGVKHLVHVLPPAPPEQLVERSAQHDIGLALEPGDRANNRLAMSNKLLVYLLAGLAVAVTDVPGQRAVMEVAGDSGLLFKPGDARALAGQLQLWCDQPELLARAKASARALGETRFCWEREKHKLVGAIGELFRS